jgi:hypothetical protein
MSGPKSAFEVSIMPILAVDSSSFFLQLLVLEFLLKLEARLKGWDKMDLAIWQSFFAMIFPPLNSTPTPPFIG